MNRELWDIVFMVNADKNCMIHTKVVNKTYYCLILGMISRRETLDVVVTRSIAYIK